MIGAKHDQRAPSKAGFVQGVDDAADFLVDIAHHAVIAVTRAPDPLVRQCVPILRMRLVEPAAVRVERVIGNRRNARHVDRVRIVTVPVRLRRNERRMRMRERDGEEKRPIAAGAGEIVNALHAGMRDLLVVVHLHAAHARTCLDHVAHADSRRAVAGTLRPVRHPQKICRVDVRRQALVEAVELVRSDEVHLAAQDRAIAGRAQVMRHRRNRRGKFARVVERVDRMRKAARQHRKARRRADRRIAIRVVEYDAASGECGDRRRLHQRMAVDRQGEGGELVRHQQHDVQRRERSHATRAGCCFCASPGPTCRLRS